MSAGRESGLRIDWNSIPLVPTKSLPFLFQGPASRAIAEPLFNKDSQIEPVDLIIYVLEQVGWRTGPFLKPVNSESYKVPGANEVQHFPNEISISSA